MITQTQTMQSNTVTCNIPKEALKMFAPRKGVFRLAMPSDPSDKDPYPVAFILGVAAEIQCALFEGIPPKHLRGYLRSCGPYTFEHHAACGIVPVNREYRPLGLSCNAPYPSDWSVARPMALPDGRLNLDWCARTYTDRQHGNCREYLYNDGCLPWQDIDHLRAYWLRLRGISRRGWHGLKNPSDIADHLEYCAVPF